MVYQKYKGTSKVGCATRSPYASSGPKAEGVPTNNQRGGHQNPLVSEDLDKDHQGGCKCGLTGLREFNLPTNRNSRLIKRAHI